MIFASSHFHRDHDLLRGGGFALAAASDKSGLSKLIGEPFSSHFQHFLSASLVFSRAFPIRAPPKHVVKRKYTLS